MKFLAGVFFAAATTAIASFSQLSVAQNNYFVSSSDGRDSRDGSSPENAWSSLRRVNRAKLQPGDTVHFKSGDVFVGQLAIDESGEAGAPIHFTAYGEGDMPVIDGGPMKGGSALAAIIAVDQDHLELSHLLVRNFRKSSREGIADVNAYGILVKNTGKRDLRGFEFHHLVVEDVFPVRARKSFNQTSVTGIRFETNPAKDMKSAHNTGDIYLHDNFIQRVARFGIGLRHQTSKLEKIKGSDKDYDVDVRIVNNRCEDTSGSCVLMNGVLRGLLESNSFIRSGALVQPKLSVNRGSGAWFFRSKDVVAQKNFSIGSRGHNDSAGMHVDFGNENILVQYNFFVDNEGYGTEILGKNKHIIWRHNISVADASRPVGVVRPEGGKSQYPGKTLFISDFAVPKRVLSEDIYIYNNTYIVAKGSDPMIELNGSEMHVWNNVFVVEQGARLGRKVTIGWKGGDALDMRGNLFSGAVSPHFVVFDPRATKVNVAFAGDANLPSTYAVDMKALPSSTGIVVEHPAFPAAGKGILSHISEYPSEDIYGNAITNSVPLVGAGMVSSTVGSAQ